MPKEQSKKNVWLIPVCILAAVALIAALVFASSAERKSIVKNTLSTFYQALYIESDFDAMTQCLAEESRSGFEAVMSMAGITPGFYRNYAQDAVAEVGQDFTIDVRLKELSEYGTADVATLQKTFPNTEKAVLARYEIVFISQKGFGERLYQRNDSCDGGQPLVYDHLPHASHRREYVHQQRITVRFSSGLHWAAFSIAKINGFIST